MPKQNLRTNPVAKTNNPVTVNTMNTLPKILALSIAAAALTACSQKEEISEADVQAAADKAAKEAVAASEKQNEDKIAALQADSDKKIADAKAEMEGKLADEKAKLQQEMEAKLAQESEALKKQFTASNAALKSQFESLKEKYESAKDKLPEDIVSQVSAKLPELSSSLGNLEGLASKFNPTSLEQLSELKTKYEKELAVAKKIADEVLKLLGKGSLESMLPKL